MTPAIIAYAIIGGLVPSFIWLYLILREDAAHPEPRTMIAFAFILGMAVVPFAIPLEQWVKSAHDAALTFSTIGAWALIEELLKYAVAAAFILWRPVVDEDIDYVIYLITIALGFAAAENALFLLTPLKEGLASGLLTGNLRFIGSTLLHVIASSAIGFSLAFSHRWDAGWRIIATTSGVILAVALHAGFNALIIAEGASTTLYAVFLVWIGAIALFAMFEVLKYFQNRALAHLNP